MCVTCISSAELSDSPDSYLIYGTASVSSRTTHKISQHVATVNTSLMKTQATVVHSLLTIPATTGDTIYPITIHCFSQSQ